MKKRLFLIFHGRFPSEKAASLFAAKSAETFGNQGIKTILIVPRRKGIIMEDPHIYYGLNKSFEVVYINTISVFGIKVLDKLAFSLSYFFFSVGVLFYIKKNNDVADVIFSNEILPLVLVSYIRPYCFYEMHDFPESKLGLFGWCLKKMKWILVHNKWKLSEVQRTFRDISHDRFLYEPNAVDLNAFNLPISKEEARKRLLLPLLKKIIVYTGHLYTWKGVDTLAESARILPDDFFVIFVGGTKEDVDRFREKYGNIPNISVVGHVYHQEIPLWQKAADVLVLPNTAKEKISAFYTSPMKLFEYMASKRPIVATDIPSLREIVNDENAIIVKPDDPRAMSEGIMRAIQTNISKSISDQAFQYVINHTWDKRAERIIDFYERFL